MAGRVQGWERRERPVTRLEGPCDGTVADYELRVSWLEKEMRSLQEVLERHKPQVASDYWNPPPPRPPAMPAPPPPPPVVEGHDGKGKEEWEEETLRSVPITFPKLPEAGSRTAALEAGDWLAQLAPLVGDVSQKAAAWWGRVMELCMELYRSWLTASPLERLHMEPRGWSRPPLDSRGWIRGSRHCFWPHCRTR